MKKLTKKQSSILSFIRIFKARTGQHPSIRTIGREFGIKSPNGVRNHLIALERKGKLIRREFMYHGIEVVDDLRLKYCGLVS